jgi:hypothetical protein
MVTILMKLGGINILGLNISLESRGLADAMVIAHHAIM